VINYRNCSHWARRIGLSNPAAEALQRILVCFGHDSAAGGTYFSDRHTLESIYNEIKDLNLEDEVGQPVEPYMDMTESFQLRLRLKQVDDLLTTAPKGERPIPADDEDGVTTMRMTKEEFADSVQENDGEVYVGCLYVYDEGRLCDYHEENGGKTYPFSKEMLLALMSGESPIELMGNCDNCGRPFKVIIT